MPLNLFPDQTAKTVLRTARSFNFEHDSPDFDNGLLWIYQPDPATGKMIFSKRIPKPKYSHRCFALARVVRQFFYHALFAADAPVANDKIYRERVRAIIGRHLRIPSKLEDRIIIPGFAGLREFSRTHEMLFKAACGPKWRAYFLRSHWRMIFPFPRAHQTRVAEALVAALKQNLLPIIHTVKFPSLTINHAVLLFKVAESERGWEFESYDPNNSKRPEPITFDRKTQTFYMSANDYWAGGELNVSQIYQSWSF